MYGQHVIPRTDISTWNQLLQNTSEIANKGSETGTAFFFLHDDDDDDEDEELVLDDQQDTTRKQNHFVFSAKEPLCVQFYAPRERRVLFFLLVYIYGSVTNKMWQLGWSKFELYPSAPGLWLISAPKGKLNEQIRHCYDGVVSP